MSNMLRILLIDDNPDDRVLVIRELRREFPDLQVKQIIEAEGFARALEAGDFDLVITDYQLRWSDGLAVLRAVRARWPDCPVVMFTATGNEEIAVEAMKAGLDDYVLKSPKHFVRLPAALRSALERARQRQALKEAQSRYRSLFDCVPVGLYRARPEGGMLDANPALVQMLGYPDRESLLAVSPDDLYVDPEDCRRCLLQMEREGFVRDFEARLRQRDGGVIWVRNNAHAVRDEDGRVLHCEGSMEDITERKRMEEALRVSHRFLEIANRHTQMIPLLEEFVAEVKNFTGCAAVGLRILDEEGNIPYEAYVGFSQRFYESESPLSIKSDQCICINVIKGDADPKLPFYTAGGSFYMNGTTRFLATVSEEEKGQTRNVCNQFGYESVALVPIRLGDRILGLIHVADPQENMVPQEKVEVLEGAAMELGTALQRVQAEEQAAEHTAELELMQQVYESLTRGDELDRVLQLVAEGTRSLFASHAATVYFLDEEGQHLLMQNWTVPEGLTRQIEKLTGLNVRQIPLPLVRGGYYWRTIEEQQALLISDPQEIEGLVAELAAEHPSLKKLVPAIVRLLGYRTVLTAPLLAEGRVVGVMDLGSRERLGEEHRHCFERLAAQMGLAIERARLYNEVQASRDYFQVMLNGLHDQVLVIDRDYRISEVNAAFLRQTGRTREEVISQLCYEVTHRRDRPCGGDEHPCPAQRVWESGEQSRAVHIHYDWEGKETYIDVAASPLRDTAGRVTGVIEAYRDVTAEHQLEEKLSAVHALGRDLILAVDEAHIAQAVVDVAERVLELRVFSLWLVDEKQEMLVRRASTAAEQAADFPPLPLDSERSIAVAVARTGETICLPDVTQDARYIDGGFGSRSELCVPLKVGERVIGILNAESKELDAFDQADVQLLSTLADQAALAIENARLYGETRRRAGRLAVVNRIAEAASATLHLDDLVETVYQEITPVFQADAFFIALYDGETRELDFRIRVDAGVREAPERQPVGAGFTGLVVTEKKPLLIRNFEEEQDRLPPAKRWGTMEAPASWLGVPMQIGDRVVGVISVQAYRPHAYGEEEQLLLSIIADRVAVAVENARLYERAQQEIVERKWAEEELQRTTENLRKALGATIQAMALTVETKDPYTAGHQRRVANLARALAIEVGLPREQTEGLRMAGVIHDIGKISVPGEILSKPGRLSAIEFSLIKTHPQAAYDILKTMEFPWPVAQIVLRHHERMDGSGYPQGLSGGGILLEARILAVADVVEAMSSHRPYRPAYGIDKALEEISQNRGILYDPGVVDACLKLFTEKGFEFE